MKLSSSAEASLPMTPGTRRATASMTTSGGRLAPGQHVVADRQLPVDQVVDDPLVDSLVAAAQQARSRPTATCARAASSSATALVEATARRDRGGTAAGAGRPPPPRRRRARGEHHAGPAAEGGVVDRPAGRRPAPARRSWIRRSSSPAARARPRSEPVAEVLEEVREDGEDVDAHRGRLASLDGGRSSKPGGHVDHDPARADRSTTKRSGTRAPPSSSRRSLAGLATTARTVPRRAPVGCRAPRSR